MNQKNLDILRRFIRICWVTIISVYFLILVGGVVRSTGAGMGCPDWPKCFGCWIPPTSASQLPNDYESLYLDQRVEKNERFVAMLENMGFLKLANDVRKDESILEVEPFNATKTWIEYVNRLIGALIGLFIIATFVYSLKLRKTDPLIPILSFMALVLVLFQGWLGSIVVSTNLLQWMISLHMIVALILVCLLLYIYFRAKKNSFKQQINPTEGLSKMRWVMGSALVFMLVQIVLGTQVREQVDVLASHFKYASRDLWIPELGVSFLIHRSYSILLLGLHLYFAYLVLTKFAFKTKIIRMTGYLIGLIALVIITGATMAYFAIPPFIQPVHLLLGSLIIGFQYYIWLELGTYIESPKII
ncbi:MAG: COX15/CtaA family protein [Cyclobacteriaceae bacterium]